MASDAVTAAGVISFVEKLEDHTASFYEDLAAAFPEREEAFTSYAKDSRKNKRAVVRTYRETISDALEASFAFGGLDLGAYAVGEKVSEEKDLVMALESAIGLEDKAIAFYSEVAEQSRSLLATIPMVFKSVAKKRNRRRESLQVMLREVTDDSR